MSRRRKKKNVGISSVTVTHEGVKDTLDWTVDKYHESSEVDTPLLKPLGRLPHNPLPKVTPKVRQRVPGKTDAGQLAQERRDQALRNASRKDLRKRNINTSN